MKKETDSTPGQAVLFELENVATNGHAVLHSVLKEALGKKKLDLSPALFGRFCLNSTVDKFLGRLIPALGKTQLSVDKLSDEIKSAYLKGLTADSSKITSGLRKIIEGAAKEGIQAGAISCLGTEDAKKLAAHLGLDSLGVTLQARESLYGNCINRDEWLKLTHSMSVAPLSSLAITSCSGACRSALSAGMKVMVVPGKYADFADFSGADAVVDSLDKDALDMALSLLEPSPWS